MYHTVTAISDEEIKAIVLRTLKVLESQYGTHAEVKFTQGSQRCYERDNNFDHFRIVFGLPMMRHCMSTGHLHDRDVRGLNAIISIATHEYAHAVHADIFGLERGEDCHSQQFFDLYGKMFNQSNHDKVMEYVKGLWK